MKSLTPSPKAGLPGDPYLPDPEDLLPADPMHLTWLYRRSWLAKRIIDMPSEDMTRAWYRLEPALNPEEAEALRRLEARHEIRREITNAIRWARLYGGACALMVIRGHEDMLDQPLDPEEILPDTFRGLLVLDRVSGVRPSLEQEEDLNDPDFGYPKWYDLTTGDGKPVRAHHSRILRFTGRDLPRSEEIRAEFWGDSELEHILEELRKRDETSANIARLVFQANVTTLKMSDFGETLALGTENQRQRVLDSLAMQNRLRNSFGLQILSSEDSYENHPYSFGGLSEIYETFMLDMAGASGIPATRLFGRSPAGMNATGESDLKNYYEMIGQMQERHLRPALEKLLPVMFMSLFGRLPEDPRILFEPLMPVSRVEEAEILERRVNAAAAAVNAGIISPDEAREMIR